MDMPFCSAAPFRHCRHAPLSIFFFSSTFIFDAAADAVLFSSQYFTLLHAALFSGFVFSVFIFGIAF